jgi:hypothetical protein
MRIALPLVVVLLAPCTPVCAQTASGATSTVDISSPASTTSNNRLTTPPTVVAPGLSAAGVETCLGSASGGLSLMGTGMTFGLTIPDEGCSIRLAARQLHAFGYPKAALALMCQDPHVAAAMAVTGEACPNTIVETSARARPKFAEVKTGSADRPSQYVRFAESKLDDALAQEAVTEVKALSSDEERWFALQTAH